MAIKRGDGRGSRPTETDPDITPIDELQGTKVERPLQERTKSIGPEGIPAAEPIVEETEQTDDITEIPLGRAGLSEVAEEEYVPEDDEPEDDKEEFPIHPEMDDSDTDTDKTRATDPTDQPAGYNLVVLDEAGTAKIREAIEEAEAEERTVVEGPDTPEPPEPTSGIVKIKPSRRQLTSRPSTKAFAEQLGTRAGAEANPAAEAQPNEEPTKDEKTDKPRGKFWWLNPKNW